MYVVIVAPGRCRIVRCNDPDCLAVTRTVCSMHRTIRDAQNRDPRLVTCLRLPPVLEVVMLTIKVSPPSVVLSATTFL
jgi:hypothetical protein